MSSTNKRIGLPVDVQENIILNIQKIFPNSVNKELIRTILIKEDWDLEKSLHFLHSTLSSFNNDNKNVGKSNKKNKGSNQTAKQQNQPKDGVKQKQKNKTKIDNQQSKTQKTPKEGENDSANKKKPDLFKKGSVKQKPKSEQAEQGDWVMVDKPMLNIGGTSTPPAPKTDEGNASSSESKQARRKRLAQNCSIIKQFREATDRVSAYIKEGIKVMILLRGCSGSGKTTYANQLLQKEGAKHPGNHIFSTDSYFIRSDGTYCFNSDRLQDAHEWNQKLVQMAASEGRSPIFVDNTNTRLWEMREYAIIAVKHGYVLETLEPPTPWFFNEDILFRKTNHSTPRETIRRMLDRYEANLSGEDVIRNLQLVYPPQMIPPQGVIFGLDVPLSKNLKKTLGATLNSSPEAIIKNIEMKSKINKVLPPKVSFPNNVGVRVGIGGQAPVMPPPNNNLPGSSFQKLDILTNTIQQLQTVRAPSTNSNPFSIEDINFGPYTCGNYSAPPIGLIQRNYEYFPNKDLPNSSKQSDKFISHSAVGFSASERSSAIEPTGFASSSVNSIKLVDLSNKKDDRQENGVTSGNSYSSLLEDVNKSSNDSTDDSDDESEPEYMTSSSHSDMSDEEDVDNETSPGNTSETNLEYVLISGDNFVIFQKYHVEMENVTTVEAFRKTCSDSTTQISRKFEDYLTEFMKTSGENSERKKRDDAGNGVLDHEEAMAISDNPTQSESAQCSSQTRNVNSTSERIPYLDTSLAKTAKNSFSTESSTITENIDFEKLEQAKTGASHAATNVIVGNTDFAGASSQVSFLDSELVSSKGTSTSENNCEKAVVNNPIDTLHMLFPKVSRGNLIEIFGTAQVDVDWAVGLLLDSGQEMINNQTFKPNFQTKSEVENSPSSCRKESHDFPTVKNAQTNYKTSSSTDDKAGLPSMTYNTPLGKEMGRSFSEFLLENKGIPCSNAGQVPCDASGKASNQSNRSLGAIPKTRNYIGDWDFSNDVPKPLPADPPKLQRAYYPRPTNKTPVGTNTNYADFEKLRNVNSNRNVMCSDPSVLIGNPCFVSSSAPIQSSTSILMLEKGTMTTDVKTNQIQKLESGIERLVLMFPQVSRENLEELFIKCQRDIDWAVGLLLDSGQEMSELYASLETLECTPQEKADDANKCEVPGDPEKTGQEEKKARRRKKTRHPKGDNDAIEDLQKKLESNFVLSEDHYTSERMKNYFKKKNPRKNNVTENEEAVNIIEEPEDDEGKNGNLSDDSNFDEEIVFMLDSDFILQLQARFGGLLRPNMIAEKNVVSLPLSLARQLHSYVMDSVQKHILEENIFTDEDEEYARHLQEEENRSRGAPSLLEIMDEEVALRKSQKESTNGRSMASTLSKQLLLERFPKMDPSTLASILDDTNHSLHQATFVLSSAGHVQAEAEPNEPPSSPKDNEKKSALSRQEAIKQAGAYGDVASQLYELRKDCLRKSQKAYREGNHSVALYYSDMARWYMERIEKSNSMAAKAILTGYEGWTTLDLHFLQVGEALNVLDLFVDEVIRELQSSKDRKAEVYVITGRGLHSSGGRPRLKPAVQARLIKRNLRFVEQNPGMLRVTIPRTALTSYKQQIEATA